MIFLWDANTGLFSRSLDAHSMTITAIAFHPKGASFVSAGLDHKVLNFMLPRSQPTRNKIVVWDFITCTTSKAFRAPAEVLAAAFSPSGAEIAVGCGATGDMPRKVLLYSTTGSLKETFDTHAKNVPAIAFSR